MDMKNVEYITTKEVTKTGCLLICHRPAIPPENKDELLAEVGEILLKSWRRQNGVSPLSTA